MAVGFQAGRSVARTHVRDKMVPEKEMVPAVREHPGTRPDLTGGSDMSDLTHPVSHAHGEDVDASLRAAEGLLRAVRENRLALDTAVRGVRAHLARIEKLGR